MAPLLTPDSGLVDLLRQESFTYAVDQLMSEICPGRRGWLIFDSRKPTDPWVAHLRSFFSANSDWPAGFLMQKAPFAALDQLSRSSCYGVVHILGSDRIIPKANVEALDRLFGKEIAVLTITWASDDSLVFLDEEANERELPGGFPVFELSKIQVEMRCAFSKTVATTLPLSLQVHSQGLLAVEAEVGSRKIENHFDVSAVSGMANLMLTWNPAIDEKNECFMLQSSECTFRSVPKVKGGSWPEPLTLTLLFDRTTIDPAYWSKAMSAARVYSPAGSGSVENPVVKKEALSEIRPDYWNLELRRSLADAFEQLARKCPYIRFDLRWFADVPRGCIAPMPGFPDLERSHGRYGVVSANSVRGRLECSDFSYSPGYDFCDAVDEALITLVEDLKARPVGAPDTIILIVGDSPPPPNLILGGEANRPEWLSGERSDLGFSDALDELRELGIPIGWIFLDHGANEVEGILRKEYTDFKSLLDTARRWLENSLSVETLEANRLELSLIPFLDRLLRARSSLKVVLPRSLEKMR